jgi:lysophospholipase
MDIRFFSLDTNLSSPAPPASGQYIRHGFSDVEKPIGVVVVHMGKSEWNEKYIELAEELKQHGIRLVVHEWLGQGGSYRFIDPKEGENLTDSRDDLELSRAFRTFEASGEFKKFTIGPNGEPLKVLNICHSRGAQQILRDICERGGSEDFHLFLSPLTRPKLPKQIAWIPDKALLTIAWAACKLGFSKKRAPGPKDYNTATAPFDGTLTSSKERYEIPREFLKKNQHLVTGHFSWRGLYNMFYSHQRIVKASDKAAANYATPFPNSVMIGSGKDAVVYSGEVIAHRFGMPYHNMLDAQHELLFERDEIRGPIKNLILGFFGKGPNPMHPGMRLEQLMRRNLISSSPQPAPA